MNKIVTLFLLGVAAMSLSAGCRTIKKEGPEVTMPSAPRKIATAKHSLKNKKLKANDIPPVLGGIVQSDSWVIYKNEQKEEFKGHVSYDNSIYVFKADYALSERALNRFSARGNVYLRQNEPDGSFYEAYCDKANFNYKAQQGTLTADKKRFIKLVYSDEKKQTVTATARKATFDLEHKIFTLEKDVRVERPTPEGTQVFTSQKATFKQLEDYAILEGNATLTDGQRTLEAETIIYDGAHNASYAYGARPLAHGTTEQGTFAIIADKVQSDNEGQQIHLDGQVQGWFVSPKINESDINTKF